ncbi:MAG: hypothetical protein E4H14_05620 [Candidatus Thorarchaeota archaeon]|nr:MAG: hypothetical protein E4H14_05620 [Candidatus Thorarchaeota archaeon]
MAQRQALPMLTANGKNIYLNNKELLAEVKRAKRKGEMTNALAQMLQMLTSRYAKKGNFVNYTYNEDMQAYAMMMLVRTWNAFNPEKSSNPFAFFTQCIKHSFIQYLNQEKRQRNIRDLILVDQGLNPSYGFENLIRSGVPEDDNDLEKAYQNVASSGLSATVTKIGDGEVDESVDNSSGIGDNSPTH